MNIYQPVPSPRHRLPQRRLAETRKIITPDGHSIHLTIGFDPAEDARRPREVFYSEGFKSGSQLEFQVQDACVLISMLLQHGLTADQIARSLARRETPDGSWIYASIIGLIVEELREANPTKEGQE